MQPSADGLSIFFGLKQRDRDIRLDGQDVVSPLGFAMAYQPTTDIDPAVSETNFFANLGYFVPTRMPECWGDELGANVALTERSLLHAVISWPRDAPSER